MGRGVNRDGEFKALLVDFESLGLGRPTRSAGFSMNRAVGDGPLLGSLLLLYCECLE